MWHAGSYFPGKGLNPYPPAVEVEVEVSMIVKTPGAEDTTNKGLLSASYPSLMPHTA